MRPPRTRKCLIAASYLITSLGALAIGSGSSPAAAQGTTYIQFPDHFQWCVATAAHQIEGGNFNSDWWDWEQIPGKIVDGDTSAVADDHWNRIEEDIALMKNINITEYRMSVEWAKIEPAQGQWDYTAIAHYRDEINSLLNHGIQPLITLHHYTFPRWVSQQGGWEWSETPAEFEKFVRFVYTNVGSDVRDWITVNEPTVTVSAGYLVGLFPPGKSGGLQNLIAPLIGIMKAHALAYHALHDEAQKIGKTVRIGMAHHLRIYDPLNAWNPADIYAAHLMDEIGNWALVTALETGTFKANVPLLLNVNETIPGLAQTQDFIGLNYYSRDHVQFSITSSDHIKTTVPQGLPVNDLGWEIYPEGMYRILKAIPQHVPNKPIIVTENGIADAKDTQRTQFIEDHLAAMKRAMDEGVTVEGYCHWSIYDNFEWDNGYSAEFGLYQVNYKTQQRTLRASGQRYGEIAAKNGFYY